ncbi:serine-protein kinase ATM [Eudromia elegans]
MSLTIHDLFICCRDLENDRATARRDGIKKFKQLLRDSDIVLQLDRNSDSKQARQLDWDAVFEALQRYFHKEIRSLTMTNPNVSVSTQVSRQKKMQDTGSLIKYFIRRANERGPKLRCQDLLNYVLKILRDATSCAVYGGDCSSVLLKDILSVRKYWCEISQQQWSELLILYGQLYLHPSGNVNRVLAARIIHTLMRGYCFQTDGLSSDVFVFFSKAMLCVRQEENTAGLDHILAAMNIFCNTFAANCRIRICKIGEEILPTVLYIWSQYRPKDSLKESIIELFRLQVHIHHPKGAKSQEKGAYDSTKWQSILFNLYDMLVNEINLVGSRGKYSSGSRNVAVKENLVELMADVCHQVFVHDPRDEEISQSYTISPRDCSEGAVPSKRRKIELGWNVIRDNLQRSQKDFDVIPWLQITARLISKYPMSLPNCEIPLVLNVLHTLLPQQRRGERTLYVLKCLIEVALCQSQKSDLKNAHKLELQRTWTKIWSLTIRSISFQQIEIESFGLLGAMIQGNLVVTDKELWKIFVGPVCKPSSSAVCCLAVVMSACSVPENLDLGMEQNNSERNLGSILKEAIMKWVLSCYLEEEMEECVELPPVLCSDFPHLLLQKILVSLTMKNSRAAVNFFQNAAECVQHLQVKEEISFSDVEELYLQTTFDEIDIFSSFAVNSGDKNVTSSRLAINQNLRETLEHCLTAMSEKLLSNYAPKSKLIAAEHLVRCVGLLVGVLGCYCYTGMLTEEEACKSELFQRAKSLIHYAGESICFSKNRLNEDAQVNSLRTLISQYTKCLCNCTKNTASRMLSDLFLRLLTSKLMNDLVDICKHLMTITGKPSEVREFDRKKSDPEESIMEVDNQVSDDLFDGPSVPDITDTNESGEMQNVTGAVSPLAEEQLTKQDLLLLEILRFLCICATTVQAQKVSFRASDVRRNLLMLTDRSTFNSAKPLHLHMYLVLLKELPIEENLLPEDDVTLLKPLSDVCSMYRQDQEVCKVILNNLLPIAVGLAQSNTQAEEIRHAQGQFLTVVGAFWYLAQEGKCTAPVRLALLNCMKALLETDPHSEWAILNVIKKDIPVSGAFPHFLADSNHQVRILAAKSITSLFQDVKRRDSSGLLIPLPLKLQQKAFENAYLQVQEGMRNLVSGASPEVILDEQCNRKAVLLMLITMVLCCSPVCEKQALFAICQSMKENGLEPLLVKKVLKKVSDIFGYKNVEDFMTSHLDYLVMEWLKINDSGYNLSTFPYVLLNCTSLEEFYRSCYKVLVPHLVIRSQFGDVKSLASMIEKDWKQVLADCFPKILVNILPYFAYENQGKSELAEQRDTASKVYDMLTDESCLGKQQTDSLSHSNLPEIVVELLMTLHETPDTNTAEGAELSKYIRDLDPAPNPPHFPSYVIKATLDYINNCHKSKLKSLIAVLSKNPDSFQKILLALCKQASDTSNVYKKHRVLIIYHLFVSLLLKEIKDGLGGAWAFVLRDVIYTLIHHINSRPSIIRDVSMRSFSLCCDLLHHVCHTAVTCCNDALESHLPVIVGTLIPLAVDQPEIQEQVLGLLKYLVIDNKDNESLYQAIKCLDPFPEYSAFKDLRATQQKIKYSKGAYSLLEEINHFLSVSVCDSLPLTRLEGLYDLRKQLEKYKDQMKDLLKYFQENPEDSAVAKLVVNLLQLSKMAINHTGQKAVLEAVGSCLGEIGPMDFSTIALQHTENGLASKAVDLLEDRKHQWVFVMLTQINTALTDTCIDVRAAAVSCLKNILATKSGSEFWEMYKNKADPMLIYLQPFRMSRKKFFAEPTNDTEPHSETLDDANLWIPLGEHHEPWIKNLTSSILASGGVQNEVLQLMKPLCEVKTDLCRTLLPYLIHDILLQDSNESWRNLLSVQIQKFFTACCKFVSSSSRNTTPPNSNSEQESQLSRSLDKVSRRTMLAVVDYLRRQKRSVSGTVFDDSFWLDLNYLEVATAAQSCAAHFTALLYAEIYADKIKRDKEQQRSSFKAAKSLTFEEESQKSTITILNEKSKEETGISLQDLLMDIYRSIGEPDSLYGCGGGRMLQPLARIRTYEHEAVWGKALVTYDLETSLPPSTRQAGIIEALQNFGLCNTLSTYLKGLEHENTEWSTELQEIHFQAAWRNMQWGHISPAKSETGGPGYHESLYDALQSLRDNEFAAFSDILKDARVKEVEELCKGSLESVYSLYPTLCRLQIIGELENTGQLFSSDDCRSVTTQQLNDTYVKWQRQSLLLKDSDFRFQEPVMALRTVLLEILLEKESENTKTECIKDILTNHLVELSKLARAAKNTQLSERAMFQIKQCNPSRYGVSEWQLEEAEVFWAKKEESLALNILKGMIKKLDADRFQVDDDPHLKLMYTECLRLCGTWLAETCLENPTVIMQKYLEKAVEIASSCSGEGGDELKKGRMKAFLSLARFSDNQYQRIENYMKSSEFENKQALLKKAKEEVGLLRERRVETNRYTVKVQRELELDECAIHALTEDRKRFLCKAVENYISCLLSGEEHDMWIFRLCSLWLENSGVDRVNEMMKKNAEKIPSYKFLPLMYQLAARMGTKKMGGLGFREVLNSLISRISLDHPHHTLFIILALANANKDELLSKPQSIRRNKLIKNAPKEISQLDVDRMEAASNIINIIRRKSPRMVRDVEALCDAYIALANLDATPWKAQRKGINIPADQPITKLKNLEDVVVPTMEIKVDPMGVYENIVTIRCFKPEFRLAGGLNLPKIIDCVGSDGKERRQLVKGRDDLRQDAVMQQVFQMCNTLLQENTETRKRKLTIRRYKVVPLSQRSGVLEWCSGTTPIGEFLVSEAGAHKRYRPKDFSSYSCHKLMMDAQKKHSDEKYSVFMKVCENFQPVFRYFCMEKFLDPAVWFEKRLAYTRSVATSSIVGYILGLGDRHVQNILIDEQTAELVHIDLGVAFEQGKILPTPETVPFRLTRDIVDGMGITGVEGVFRRCCEKTMDVMRNSQEALLTIVEVLLYDPLFDWTMNPLKALYLQQRTEDEADMSSTLNTDPQECNRKASSDDQSFNKVAERVLMRLQEKLKGVEEGTVLSVGGQVNLLIQQAMDPKNLSKLFPGWKPWV